MKGKTIEDIHQELKKRLAQNDNERMEVDSVGLLETVVHRLERLQEKEDRIEELEEALRESVRITADREVALDAEIQLKTKLDEKVTLFDTAVIAF